MKTQAIVAARIEFDAEGPPRAPDFDDLYHPRVGAAAQAAHVFIDGNGLPGRWQRRADFTILETGFGLGNNFLATWQAWLDDDRRCQRLHYVAIEAHPPSRDDLQRAHRQSPWPALAAALHTAWPPLTPNLHLLDLDEGRVRLLLAFGDVGTLLPELSLRADAFYLDGFAPARNPAMWDLRVLKALGRRAAPGATAATWSVARAFQDGLTTAGFELERVPGIGGKREITRARFVPRWAPAPSGPSRPATALVIGAGLAGAFAARALAEDGIAVTVLEAAEQASGAASGNVGGLFHGTVHTDDGLHARLLRAAALHASRVIAPLCARGSVRGQADGLLRLGGRALKAMRLIIAAQHLPADWVQVLEASEASAQAGVMLTGPAWWFPSGGWVSPIELVGTMLKHGSIRFQGSANVARLAFEQGRWQALDPRGTVIAEAECVVLASGASLQTLAAPWVPDWPLTRSRGQVTGMTSPAHGLRGPVAGDGYVLPLSPDELLCGATQADDDVDDQVREVDHRLNLERLQRLTGLLAREDIAALTGRVGWRLLAADRLPIAGAMPARDAPAGLDQADRWPRVGGLHVLGALGGRGITLAPLLGRLLAAQISGTPMPVERSLFDAVDPVRWWVRQSRRS